jgi:hypothetical protein
MSASLLAKPHLGAVLSGAPPLSLPRRILKHRRAMPYNRLVAVVMAVNAGWAGYGASTANWWTSGGADLGAIGLIAQTNGALSHAVGRQNP